MIGLLPAKNNIVRQFIDICLPVVRKMIFQGGTNIQDNFYHRISIMILLENE